MTVSRPKDPYVWGPNGLGLLSSVAQLALFAKFGIQSAKSKST
jgi:hypothetical protein